MRLLLLYLPKIVLSARSHPRGRNHRPGDLRRGCGPSCTYLVHKMSASLFLVPVRSYLGTISCFNQCRRAHPRARLIRNRRCRCNKRSTGEYFRQRYGDSFRLEVVRNSGFPRISRHPRLLRRSSTQNPVTGYVYWAQEAGGLEYDTGEDLLLDLPWNLFCIVQGLRFDPECVMNVECAVDIAPQSRCPGCKASRFAFLPLAWGRTLPTLSPRHRREIHRIPRFRTADARACTG